MASHIHPGPRFLLTHPAHFIALGCGSGLVPIAPGTFGSLFGWISFVVLEARLGPSVCTWLVLGGFVVGVWACQRTGRDLRSPDHGAMVWDEVIAMWGVLLFAPQTLAWQAVAFILFRFFDIVKPPPIRTIDRRWKGGLGVMLDDIAAAFYTLLVLAMAIRLFGG